MKATRALLIAVSVSLPQVLLGQTAITSLPFTITTSGSYNLTKNLTEPTGKSGITVSADNVTIDLNGFALIGDGTANVNAILVASRVRNLSIRNGTISNWGANGINAYATSGAVYENLRIIACYATGLAAGPSSYIKGCVVFYPNGIAGGIQTADGSTLVDCTCNFNSDDGFRLGPNCTIVNCTAEGNQGYGIITGTGAKVTNCTTGQNGSSGISVDLGSSVQGCVARGNTVNGIVCTNNCNLRGNTCDNNNASFSSTNNGGIYTTGTGNTIDSNSCTANGNGGGFVILGSHNLVTRNSGTAGSGYNYQIAPANAYGPVIDMSAGGPISNTNPWTNWIH